MSRLLFEGFNANILTVDSGIDVAAIKDGKTYLFQVKTRHWNARNTVRIFVEVDALNRYKDENALFVLIARDRETERVDAVIIGIDKLFEVREKSRIRSNQKGNDSLLLIFTRRADGGVTLNNGGRVDEYTNIWNRVGEMK